MLDRLFGKKPVDAGLGEDLTKEYSDVKNWKLSIDTSSIHDFNILNTPNILQFYLEHWNNGIKEQTSKKLQVLPGKVFEFWTKPEFGNKISVNLRNYFKVVFKQSQTNRGDNEDYWDRKMIIDKEHLKQYLNEITPLIFLFDHLNYGYNMVQTQSRYETTYLRGASGWDVNWDTKHTFDRDHKQREFIKYQNANSGNPTTEWISIEDRKTYVFDNPVTGQIESFMMKKYFPEENQIEQYDRVHELLGIAERNKLDIRLEFNVM
jgi:hypothetical protein